MTREGSERGTQAFADKPSLASMRSFVLLDVPAETFNPSIVLKKSMRAGFMQLAWIAVSFVGQLDSSESTVPGVLLIDELKVAHPPRLRQASRCAPTLRVDVDSLWLSKGPLVSAEVCLYM